jgi:hypothetical protein
VIIHVIPQISIYELGADEIDQSRRTARPFQLPALSTANRRFTSHVKV